MPFDPRKIPTSPSQDHLDIEDVQENIVLLKDGGARLVLATTAINFGLLSEKEQDATIYAYAGLLNSLTFSIQIVIRSAKKDISHYLKLLEAQEKKQKSELLVDQIKKYRAFVEQTVKQNEVLDKKFYIIIPMTALELGAAKAVGSIFSLFKKKRGLPFSKDYILERAKTNLHPKRDHLIRLTGRLGLKTHQLTSQELIQLFFSIYNPEAQGQKMAKVSEYKAPLVEPAFERAPSPPSAPAVFSSPMEASQLKAESQPNPLPVSSLPVPPDQTPSPPPEPSEPEKTSPSLETNRPAEGADLQRQIDNLIQSVKKR